MEGMVLARESVVESEVVVVVVMVVMVVGAPEVERVCGLCFRRTAVKNWCSDG